MRNRAVIFSLTVLILRAISANCQQLDSLKIDEIHSVFMESQIEPSDTNMVVLQESFQCYSYKIDSTELLISAVRNGFAYSADGFFIKNGECISFFQGGDQFVKDNSHLRRIVVINLESNKIEFVVHIKKNQIFGISTFESSKDSLYTTERICLIYPRGKSFNINEVNLIEFLNLSNLSKMYINCSFTGEDNIYIQTTDIDTINKKYVRLM